VTVPYVRYSIRAAHWFLARALRELLEAARPRRRSEIDGLCVSSFTLAPDTAVGLTQHLGLSPRWLDHIPIGGASGVVALRRAARAVQAGDADVVACIAATPTTSTRSADARPTSAVRARRRLSLRRRRAERELRVPDRLLHAQYGATREDFGKLCVAQRDNALAYPHALFKKPLTLDEYLDARPIAEPIHLFDCVMPCAGAEAFLVMREASAREALGLPTCALGTIERHNAFPDDPIQMRGGWALDRDDLYAQAGVGPQDIDFLQTYDDYPVISLMQIEDLGFCARARPGLRARSTASPPTASLPAQHLAAASCRWARPAAAAVTSGWSRRCASSPAGRRAPGAGREARAGQRLRHDQLRPRPVHRRGDPGAAHGAG
jgi:acetyl-CoA acetyltransferase